MTDMKLEDPTVDVGDIETYRLAFLMQFFVQHKRRFRFPRLRLQDLYQRVVKHPDATAFSDLVARILRFLSHGDPDICIDSVDQALDRFAMEKRTPYRINMQRHRNGKPVHQLGPAARAALLDNLIESVYDEQPDFNFAAGFNPPNPISSSGTSRQATGPASSSDTAAGVGSLFGESGANDVNGPDFSDSEDVNVLIKAGQDAQGCSYYYMDDLRLYRERPQSGICSQWDVAVGPTATQWQSFIASLSRNEKEYDLYCFLNQDLFELVKQSLDSYELHAPNNELDSCNLRAKEMNELADLRRRKGTTVSKLNPDGADSGQLPLSLSSGLSANGPKSASPAFSGGHGACGIGSLGSASSGAPLTPSSARTPTSAPPATASNGYPVNPAQAAASVDVAELSAYQKSEAHTPRDEAAASWPADCGQSGTTQRTDSLVQSEPGLPVPGENYVRNTCLNDSGSQLPTLSQPVKLDSEGAAQPAKPIWIHPDGESPNHRSPAQLPFTGTAGDGLGANASSWPSPGRPGTLNASVPSNPSAQIHRQQSAPSGMDSRLKAPGSCQNVGNSPSTGNTGGHLDASAKKAPSPETTPTKQFDATASSSQAGMARHQVYSFDPSGKDSQDISEYNNGTVKVGSALRSGPTDLVDPSAVSLDCQMPFGPKPPMGPATALVPPMLGIPDCGPTLTQEQWENRKSKIAQLEKIHSTLSKSKSASTPGAVTAAAAAAAAAAGSGGGTFPQRVHPNGPPTTPTHGLPNSQLAPAYGPGASCQSIQRQTTGDPYSTGRPALPPSGTPMDAAQRDWDRMCMDYQRDRTEPLGTRFHPSFRQPMMSDPSGCPVMPPDAPMSPLGTSVGVPGPLLSTDTGQCPPGRQYADGPPVMMVPPNNSNFTMVSTAYSPSSLGAAHHYRYAAAAGAPLVHSEQVASVMGPGGQKRAFYGPAADPWFSPYNNNNNGAILVSTPASDAGCTYAAGPISSMSAASGPRFGSGPLGTGVSPAPAPSGPPNPSNPVGPAPGRPTTIGKVGGKKRKTVSSARVSVAATPVNHPAAIPSAQPIYHHPYGKTAVVAGGPSAAGAITPGKPSYPSAYAPDPSTPGYHPHRSMYISSPGHPHMIPMCAHPHANFAEVDPCFGPYPDMLGSGATVSRSVNPSTVPVDGRRALTPKGNEVCPVGPMGSTMPCNAQGRIQPNCGPMYPGNGSFGNNSVAPAYMHPSDMPGSVQDAGPGMRPAVSCTQHLTSASLASLARLSQLSGPEGPYGSSASSAPLGSGNMGMTPGLGSYPNRPSHSDNPPGAVGLPQQTPPQGAMRGHPAGFPAGMKMHETEVPSSLMYSKFGPHVYHGSQPPTLPSVQPSSAQGPSHNQHQSQQPPSIQVNNTFFNAQLNVQQMNYQHVTAPGSTGQMQIHFVQQQQQQQQQHQQQGDNITTGPVHGNRTSRPPDSASRMGTAANNGPAGPDYYTGPNSSGNFGPDPPSIRASSYGSQVVLSDTSTKPEVSAPTSGSSPSVSVGPTSAGYGNTSIQITPRTPHTIQYLPAVVPTPSEPQSGSQQVYAGADSAAAASRSRSGRMPNGQYNNNNCPTMVQFNPTEAPDLARTAGGAGPTFNSAGPPNMGHPTTHPLLSQQATYQSQYAVAQQQQQQPTTFTGPQPTGGGPSGRPANPQTTGWSGSPQGHVDSNSCTIIGSGGGGAGFPDQQLNAEAVSTSARHCNFSNQPSGRAPPSYTSDSMVAVTEAPWPGDNSGSAYPHHRIPQSYSRQQSAPGPRSEAAQQPAAVHSHTHRQQQQHYQQQSSQQHQMFMSSSVGSFADGNQVQFMMSASSASTSAQASSTTNLVTVNHMPPNSVPPESGRAFGSQNSDMKCESQSDPNSGPNAKRTLGIQDDQKPSSHGGAPHLGSGARSHWTNSEQQQQQYSTTAAYCSAGFSSSGSGAAGAAGGVAYFDPTMNGREMLAAQQSVMCSDMPPPSMQQTFSSSVLP